MKREKNGDIFKFPLSNGTFAYGKIVEYYCRIFNFYDQGNSDFTAIIKNTFLFDLMISAGTLKLDEFEKIGEAKCPDNEFKSLNPLYRYHEGKFFIVYPGDPNEKNVNRKECLGLALSCIHNLRSIQKLLMSYFDNKLTINLLRCGPLREDYDIVKYESMDIMERYYMKPEDFLIKI